jgi:hypothetical protein
MPDPTGRWLNNSQWQCPKCAWVNERADERCQSCDASVRPPADEPVRPPDPLDLISHREPRLKRGDRSVKLATKAGQTLTKVTRDQATALIGDSLRNVLKDGGADDKALGAVVDDLEQAGYALFEFGDGQPE